MAEKRSETRTICTLCYHEDHALWVLPGDGLAEILLYLFTLPLLCVGGLFYTGLRQLHSFWACGACRSRDVIPIDTPRGQELRAQLTERSA